MSDDKFEQFLQREARSYNAPPSSVPRDEMWRAIAAARGARPGGVTPLSSRKPRLRYTPWIGMAATLLVGIGIGRFALQRGGDSLPAVTAQAPVDGDRSAMPQDVPADLPAAGSPADAPAAIDGANAPPSRSLPRSSRGEQRLAAATPPNATRNGSAYGSAEPIDAFQVASRDHLVRAEALVSVVAATPRDAVMDSLTGRWAREMLTNTRLLLDSPAGDDPVRRRLLEDLETVLVQLVQRSGGAVDERALIDRTLERTQLLTRLRTSAAGI